jgi:hypothetical protein
MKKNNEEKKLRIHIIKFEFNKNVIGKDSKTKIYRDVTILSPGTFSDSLTRSPVRYDEEVLSRTYTKWNSNFLNLDHSDDVLDRIGLVMNPHFSDGKVKADLYIYPITRNAKDTIALIDSGLINWLSVEIMTSDRWDASDERYVDDMEYLGLAVVTMPACKDALIDETGLKPPSYLYE